MAKLSANNKEEVTPQQKTRRVLECNTDHAVTELFCHFLSTRVTVCIAMRQLLCQESHFLKETFSAELNATK